MSETIKIGVVSDTHSKRLPQQMVEDFRNVAFIIHAGDFAQYADYEYLSRIGKVEGVCGNMDDSDICGRLPQKKIISCGRYRIGVTHGGGPPRTSLAKVQAVFAKDKVDAVVFGHTHHPFNQTIDGVLYFNPGSPNDEIFASRQSYGILELTPEGVIGRIIEVKP